MVLFKNKKGILFIVDVLIGFIIILIGFVFLVSYYFDVPTSNQANYYSDDFLVFLSSTAYSEFSTNLTRNWIKQNKVLENELVGESIVRFYNNSDYTSFELLINDSLLKLIPKQLSFEVNLLNLNDTKTNFSVAVSKQNSDISPVVSISRGILFSYTDNYEKLGPYILEVKIW